MIEISTPIQAQSSLENVQENPPDVSVFGKDSPKKDKLGVFSKILEGLIGKPKVKPQGVTESGGFDEALDKEKRTNGKEKIFSNDKLGKKAALSEKKPLNHAENGVDDGVFSLFSGFEEQNRQLHAVFNPEDAKPAELVNSLFQHDEPLPNNVYKTAEGFIVQNITDGFENEAWDGLSALVDEGEDAQFSAFAKNESRGSKTARAFAETASNEKEPSYRLFSERPDLADQFSSLSANAGEAREGRAQEARSRKTRDRINLEVRDFRTFAGGGTAETAGTPVSAVIQTDRFDAELKADLRIGGGPQEKPLENFGSRGGFEEALSRELSEHLSSDIVRQASIILRNSGEGVIRLSLKPESLGNVKIRVEMTENKITGHIVVESSEAFKAFERELPVLEKQFQDSGFSEASLDMSFAGENGNSGMESHERFQDFQKFSSVLAASSYDAEAERSGTIITGTAGVEVLASGRTAVNMLA